MTVLKCKIRADIDLGSEEHLFCRFSRTTGAHFTREHGSPFLTVKEAIYTEDAIEHPIKDGDKFKILDLDLDVLTLEM